MNAAANASIASAPLASALRLDQCPKGAELRVINLLQQPLFGAQDERVTLRLKELGFLPGALLKVIGFGLLGRDPLAVQVNGKSITTIEGVSAEGLLNSLQEGFHENHGLHCGFCTPGMIMRSTELLANNPNPTEEEIRWGISGNLCRCTGYNNIVKAIQYASAKNRGVETASTEPQFV